LFHRQPGPISTTMVLLERLILSLTLLLSCPRSTHCFAAARSRATNKSMSLVEMRQRSLLNKAKSAPNTKTHKDDQRHNQQQLSKSYILGALDEAIFRQQLANEALHREIERRKKETQAASLEEFVEEAKVPEKSDDDIFLRIEARRDELHNISSRLSTLQSKVEQMRSQPRHDKLKQVQLQMIALGFGSIFKQPESSWKTTKSLTKEFGRPAGFNGDVFHSPLGVPILVGRMNAHKDEAMRSAAQGADLWFQVEDYNGSRVLLRTSLVRGLRGSKECRQYAANLAAKYSVWGEQFDSVPVMYTDSRKVAKRGNKVGNMKKNKSLGRIMGYPRDV